MPRAGSKPTRPAAAASHVEAGTKSSGEDQEAAEDAGHHDPVEQLQRALDATADEQQRHAQQKRADADGVHDIGIRGAGQCVRANRKKIAPAAVPADAGHPTWRKYRTA